MRRTIPAILTSGVLVLALSAAAPAAIAQDQTMGDHPVVGAWVIHPFPDDPTQVSLMVFEPSGTLVTTDNEGAIGIGAWTATDDRTIELAFEELATGEDGSFVGIVTIRASGDIADDGQSFSGTWTLEPPAAMAEMMGVPEGELGPGEVTAERIAAEPMGEPVAPLPDFSQMAPPAPEASPAS